MKNLSAEEWVKRIETFGLEHDVKDFKTSAKLVMGVEDGFKHAAAEGIRNFDEDEEK